MNWILEDKLLVPEIEKLFVVFPERGLQSKAPTGDLYRTYTAGISISEESDLEQIAHALTHALYSTFINLAYGRIPERAQGLPDRYISMPLQKTLYWRTYPTLAQENATSLSIYCRALVV
tara:strand:- start:4079 stop:4438 length:360 start_codon:yes stop_codon:yes gene_type:complete